MLDYDVIIIGSGPGGYVCAIKCAQLGLKTACIEGEDTLGGTCLNIGCIPSKALLHASELFEETTHNFSKLGIETGKTTVNWDKMLDYKADIVNQNTKGIEFLFKKNKIDLIKGWATIKAPGVIQVNSNTFNSKSIIIATGSKPAQLKDLKVDEKTIVSSTGALSLKKIPKTMTVVGAGVIGLELGSVYSRLGTEVTVIEYLEEITPGLDKETAKMFRRILSKQGINFILGAAVQNTKKSGNKHIVNYSLKDNKKIEKINTDIILVATGRKPFTEGLNLEKVGIELNEQGQIVTDKNLKTTIDGIYAIGDIISGPMLAHKAEDEGIALAEMLAGQAGHVNYDIIPSVIYTSPEVASVGKTEEQLQKENISYKVGKFSFMGNGRAKACLSADGFAKILSDKNTDRILGGHIIGPSAGDLIHEICVAMEFGASAEDLSRTCHAHPTFSEAVREAALACGDGAIHS
ncbi:MAG: dihydrolipoyl dehydrogenase [Paracoccaceae bacterium]